MDIEQHFTQLVPNPAEDIASLRLQDLKKWVPKRIIRFLKQWVNRGELSGMAVIDPSALNGQAPFTTLVENGVKSKIILIKLNAPEDIRLVEKHLLQLNECLPIKGCLMGCLCEGENQEKGPQARNSMRKNGIPTPTPGLFKSMLAALSIHKKFTRRFEATQGVPFPGLETCGRLLAHGFCLLEVIENSTERYFIAQKVRNQEVMPKADIGPIIRLKRVGQYGKRITVYKFRTMYPYSEYLQEYIYERFGLENGGKMKNDPRVTPLGRFLRKRWLDEIPMLINLLKGELKVFGVRPLTEHYLSLYPEEFRKYRTQFKPGMIPPFYADLPVTLEEIIASEKKYLEAYEKAPLLTDWRYICKVLYNIFLKGVRSN